MLNKFPKINNICLPSRECEISYDKYGMTILVFDMC